MQFNQSTKSTINGHIGVTLSEVLKSNKTGQTATSGRLVRLFKVWHDNLVGGSKRGSHFIKRFKVMPKDFAHDGKAGTRWQVFRLGAISKA